MYFSEKFNIDREIIKKYGAYDISLLCDNPLFVDPFLLFNSSKEDYKKINENITQYLIFLLNKSDNVLTKEELKKYYFFTEVKENWLGYSLEGNVGRGNGEQFAYNLNKNLKKFYQLFKNKKINIHLNSVCLIEKGIGNDKISDFAVNFIKDYLISYTQKFAKLHIDESKLYWFRIEKARFDNDTKEFKNIRARLPYIIKKDQKVEYVLLTPIDILRADKMWVDRKELVNSYDEIYKFLSVNKNELTRNLLNEHFTRILREHYDDIKKKHYITEEKAKSMAIESLIQETPDIIDAYIKIKEKDKNQASELSIKEIELAEEFFHFGVMKIAKEFNNLEEEFKYLNKEKIIKKFIEVIKKRKLERYFYIDGKPISKDNDLQRFVKLFIDRVNFLKTKNLNFKLCKAVNYEDINTTDKSILMFYKEEHRKKLINYLYDNNLIKHLNKSIFILDLRMIS